MTGGLIEAVFDIIRPYEGETRYNDAFASVKWVYYHGGYNAAVDKALKIAEAYEDIRALREEREKEHAA